MLYGTQNLSRHGIGQRFVSLNSGPAQTLTHGLTALRRGDAALVLTAQRRSERAAMLGEIVRLSGPGLHRTVRMEGGEVGPDLAGRMQSAGICPAIAKLPPYPVPTHPAPAHVPEGARTLLVIDDAEMLPTAALAMLANVRDDKTGVPVQLLLAGSGHLVMKLCAPRCDRLWRRVRLALSLEDAACSASVTIAQLEQEIARTQARLEAQRRILSIFADSKPDAAPRFN